jgi:hypothetical protein
MPPAPRKNVNRGDISEMMGFSKTDLLNFREFLCERTQLRTWSTYLSRKDPNSNEKGPERKHLVLRAVDAIRNNEEKFIGTGTALLTKEDNQLWVVVQLVQDNRKDGCVWKGKGHRDLEMMCKTATEIMKMLSIEFSGQRSATSATVRRMKDVALTKGIDFEGGAREDVSENFANVGQNAKNSGTVRQNSVQKEDHAMGHYKEENMANFIESEVDDASDDMEDYE